VKDFTIRSLADTFSDIFSAASRDPVEHLLLISYEFDDQQVLNLALQKPLSDQFDPRLLNFAQIAEIVPIVVYDARKTREHNRLPHFMELLPIRKPVWTCHHSKACLIVTRQRIHLVLGSMNLTASGLFSNREVFEVFSWAAKETDNLAVLRQFVDEVAAGYVDLESAALQGMVATVERRLVEWQEGNASGDARLVHQGYTGKTGLEALVSCWTERFGDEMPDRCIAVSPFFDAGISEPPFAEKLHAAFGSLRRLEVITDESVLPRLSRRHFANLPEARLYTIASEIGQPERDRISANNAGTDVNQLALTRKLHAKVLVLARGSNVLVYLGSANFTLKAWLGENHELGVARSNSNSADQILEAMLAALGARRLDEYPNLPPQPMPGVPDEDDEEFQDLADYPEFVRSIVLVESELEGKMHFAFECAPGTQASLQQYSIDWGGLPIQVSGDGSQDLQQAELISRLLGGRNLRFVCRTSRAVFFLPFRHAPELFAKRDRFVFPTGEDWMMHYLGVDAGEPRLPEEFLPGDAPAA
jgi:HKD family nuclease